MGKKVYYTKITPLPKNVPRQLAVDLLHSHEELIRLNPLVTAVESIGPPREALADEYYSDWYLIHEQMTWGNLLKKKMSFKGVFHNLAHGLQSHTYAPLATDLRQKYLIGGNQPGEPALERELGVDTPADGLYLREDHEITCAMPLTAGFVKKEMKAATAVMIERLTKKAELLESGKLHAMFEAGKLKTSKPSQAPTFDNYDAPTSPTFSQATGYGKSFDRRESGGGSPVLDERGYGHYYDVARTQSKSTRHSSVPKDDQRWSTYGDNSGARPNSSQGPIVSELSGSTYHPRNTSIPESKTFTAELPGDYGHAPQLQPPRPPPLQSHHSSPPPTAGSASAYSQASQSPRSPDLPHPLRIPNRASSSNSSNYRVTNNAPRPTSVQNDDAFRAASNSLEPEAARFSRMSVSQWMDKAPESNDSGQQQKHQHYQPVPSTLRCPGCEDFEGDEAAVSYHYQQAHIT